MTQHPPLKDSPGLRPRKARTLLRLMRSYLAHLHLLIGSVAATAAYASLMTARVFMLYLVLRVIVTEITPEEMKQVEQAGPVGTLVRTLLREDAEFSPFLRDVNVFLDGVDEGMGNILRPVLPQRVEDSPKRMAQVASLGTAILCFVLMSFLAAAAHFGEQYLKAALVVRVLISLRIRLLRNLLFQPLAFYNDQKRGELISRMGADVHGATMSLQLLCGDLVQQPFNILVPVALIAIIQPWLLLVVCAFVPFLMFSLRRHSRKVHRRAKVRQQATARVTEAMVQMFSGIRVVKAFGLEPQKVAHYAARNADFARDALATDRAKAWTKSKMEFLTHMIMVVAVAAAMMVLGAGGTLPAGAMIIFLGMMAQIFRPTKALTNAYTDLHDNLPGAERMFEFMDLEPGLTDRPDASELRDVVGGVRFEDVCFSYNGNGRVLEHVNLEIPAGQVVALVGPSGAGKSTLANLVPRFYDPEVGRITIDGTDIREFTRDSLLRSIAIVTQEPFLFNTTIRENIGHGRPGATMDAIVEAAKAANIHDFTVSLPGGYETVVGERGAKLSGGQCQRLTIARAILRNAKILILDEATSSLDTESERAVQVALQNLMRGRTTLVIAHRLSTVQHADKICVLQDGRVVDVGSHDELMARESLYRRLYEMQFAPVG